MPMLARYSDRRRIDMDPIQFCNLRDILCYGKFFKSNNGIGQLEVTFQNTHIFLFLRLARIFNLLFKILQ